VRLGRHLGRAEDVGIVCKGQDFSVRKLISELLQERLDGEAVEGAPPGASLTSSDAAEDFGAPDAGLFENNARGISVHEPPQSNKAWEMLKQWPPSPAPSKRVERILGVGRNVDPALVLVEEGGDGRRHEFAATRQSHSKSQGLRLEEESLDLR